MDFDLFHRLGLLLALVAFVGTAGCKRASTPKAGDDVTKVPSPQNKEEAKKSPATQAIVSDLDRLQGKWICVSGQSALYGETKEEGIWMEFKGENVTLGETGKSDMGRVTIDSSKSPKQIDLRTKENRSMPQLGIYVLEGNSLTLLLALDPKYPRPEKIGPPKEGYNLFKFERAKSK